MGKKSGRDGPDPGEGGRPTKYNPELHDWVAYNCAVNYGLNAPKHVQKQIGISRPTFYTWLREHETFFTMYWQGIDDNANPRIVRSVLKEAEGYDYNEITWERIPVGDDGKPLFEAKPQFFGKYKIPARDGMIATKVVRKRARPNGRLAEFWLRNRDKRRFADVKQLGVGGPDGGAIPIEVAPGSELWEALQEFTKAIRGGGESQPGSSQGSPKVVVSERPLLPEQVPS